MNLGGHLTRSVVAHASHGCSTSVAHCYECALDELQPRQHLATASLAMPCHAYFGDTVNVHFVCQTSSDVLVMTQGHMEITSRMPLLTDRLSPSPFRVGREVPASFLPFFFLLDDMSGTSAAALCARVSLCSSTCHHISKFCLDLT